MKTEKLHTAINDPALCLRLLARLMPQLSEQRPLGDVLRLIHEMTGARLCWLMLENAENCHLEISGDEQDAEVRARALLETLKQQQALLRVKCWHKNVGTLLYDPEHPLAEELESGVLCRIYVDHEDTQAFLFMAFTQPLFSPAVLRSVAIIIAEKLREYMTELLTREKTAFELQRIVNQYRILLDRAPVLMNSFDKHNRCVLWNGECERVFGWTIEEINQHADPLALFYPDPDVRRKVRLSVNVTPSLEMHEWYPCRRDGMTLATLWSNILLPDGEILNIGVDITERKRTEKLLEMKATTDALTRCYNRLAILEFLQLAIENCHSDKHDTHFIMVMLDLDHFKHINDSWGHPAGDQALIYFCQHVREATGSASQLGRLGGEEFLLLLPIADCEQAVLLTDQLREQLSGQPFINGEASIPLSFSAGVLAVCHNNHESSMLLTLADNALYDAKRSGRGKTVIASVPQ